MFQRIIENFLIRFGNANFFGNHQQIEVITQARAFQTYLLQGAKAVGDDADFGVATNGVKQGNRPRQRRTDFRHRINKGLVEFTRFDVQPFGPALKPPVLKL